MRARMILPLAPLAPKTGGNMRVDPISGQVGLAAASLAVVIMLAPTPARAETDVAKEINTAITHAGFAAAGNDLRTVQMHLHHTVNCLVGPTGTGFDPSEANPCKDQGNGAIPDIQDPLKRASLQEALIKVNAGLQETE